jgi:HEAT repeat protein
MSGHSQTGLIHTIKAVLVLVLTAATAAAAPTSTSTEAELLAILRSETPEADKAISCKFLAVNGSAAAVADLAALLTNPRLASWARISLEAIPAEAASAALRAAAEQLDGRLLTGVITSLGVRRDQAAVPLVAGKLAADDAEVAAAAAWSLGQIATEEAGTRLAEAILQSSSPERLDDLARAAVLCGANLCSAGQRDEAVAIYGVVRAAEVSEQRRAEAIRGTILATGEAGIPLLIKTLRDPRQRLANMAVFTARELGRGESDAGALAPAVDAALVAELDATVGAGTVDRAVLLIDVLGERNADGADGAVVVGLSQAAGHAAKPIRLKAIEALGRVGDEASVGPLLAVIVDQDQEVAAAARDALAVLPGAAVDREIVRRLREPDTDSLAMLVELVGRRRIAAVPELLPLMNHADPLVRSATIVALGPTIDLTNLDVLVTSATAPRNEAEGQAARVALREASVRMPDREACAAALITALERLPVDSKVTLLDILGEVGGVKAVATMAEAGRSGDPALEDAATRILGTWMTADAAPVLFEIATAEPGGRFKTRALRGYIRIARQFTLPDAERAEMCRKALSVATNDADRKAVLEILIRYPSPTALEVAEEATGTPGIEADARLAADAIRGRLEPAATAGEPPP